MKMPTHENTKSVILQGLFICRTSELNLRTKINDRNAFILERNGEKGVPKRDADRISFFFGDSGFQCECLTST